MVEKVIVDLSYPFTVRYRPYKHKNIRTMTAWTTIPVELRSASSEEAPIVLEWLQQDNYDESKPDIREKWYPDGPHRFVLRGIDGALYRPMGDGNIDATILGAEAGKSRSTFSLKPASHPYGSFEYPVLPAIPKGENRLPNHYIHWNEAIDWMRDEKHRFVSDDKDEQAMLCSPLLEAGLVLIDGIVWTASNAREPKLRVSTGAVPAASITLDPKPIHYCHDFPILEKEKALRFIESEGLRIAMTKDVVDVFVPEALRHDGIVLSAQQALESLSMRGDAQHEDWPDTAMGLLEELRGIRDEKSMDLSRAVRVLDGLERIAALLEDLPNAAAAQELVERTAIVRRRWRDLERPSRPEVEAMIEDHAQADAVLMSL